MPDLYVDQSQLTLIDTETGPLVRTISLRAVSLLLRIIGYETPVGLGVATAIDLLKRQMLFEAL